MTRGHGTAKGGTREGRRTRQNPGPPSQSSGLEGIFPNKNSQVKFSGPTAGKGIIDDLNLQEQSHNGPGTKVLSPSQVVFANSKNGNGNGFSKNKNKTPMEND